MPAVDFSKVITRLRMQRYKTTDTKNRIKFAFLPTECYDLRGHRPPKIVWLRKIIVIKEFLGHEFCTIAVLPELDGIQYLLER